MRIAILGAGEQARALAAALLEEGHQVSIVVEASDTSAEDVLIVGADLVPEDEFESMVGDVVAQMAVARTGEVPTMRLSASRISDLEADLDRMAHRVSVAEDAAALAETRLRALSSRRSVRLALRLAARLAPVISWIRRVRRWARVRRPSPPKAAAPEQRRTDELVAAMREQRVSDHPVSGPIVSVIILTHDGATHLRRLLPRLAETTYRPFEVIVVDNASVDGTRDLLAEDWPFPIHVIANDTNVSFSHGNNQAADVATGKYLLFLNNDVEPITEDWLGAMVSAIEADMAPSAVGAVLVYPERGQPDDLTVQHVGIAFGLREGAPHARNLAHPDPTDSIHLGVRTVPAATAAALLVSKQSFDEVGGFTLGYVYGTEDVDLCLKLKDRGPVVVQGDAVLFHHESATQQRSDRSELAARRARNWRLFAERWGPPLIRTVRKERLTADDRWTGRSRRVVAITLNRDDPTSAFGDYFTAHELGDAFAADGWSVHYAERHEDAWLDLPAEVDLVVSLIDDYDVRTAPEGTFTIAWVRNWVDRWIGRPWFDHFDLVVAASRSAGSRIREGSRFTPPIVPLATNPDRFCPGHAVAEFEADYAFTGNYWGKHRDVITNLTIHPDERFALFGRAWDQVDSLAPHWRGYLPYNRLPDVYRSVAIVLDDTAGPTIDHGFVNSRVFDALASGALVISNNPLGSADIFDGVLPTYSSADELRDLLDRYLADSTGRSELVRRLRRRVLERHTYAHRSREFVDLALAEIDKPVVAVKIAVPGPEVAQQWGDYHFAHALLGALRDEGFRGHVDFRPDWDDPRLQDADVVVQLRGHGTLTPAAGAINVMWLISHPDEVSAEEMERFDLIAIASEKLAAEMADSVSPPVVFLPQATNGKAYAAAVSRADIASELLFVGNTRNQRRHSVEWAIEKGLPLSVYGSGWEKVVPRDQHLATYFPNESLPDLYASADVVLNDHWPDMRIGGFVSNRIFDVLAAGTVVVSDPVQGLADLFGDVVPTFDSPDELARIVRDLLGDPERRQVIGEQGRAIVLQQHTFSRRANTLKELVSPLLERRPRDLDGSNSDQGATT